MPEEGKWREAGGGKAGMPGEGNGEERERNGRGKGEERRGKARREGVRRQGEDEGRAGEESRSQARRVKRVKRRG